MDIVLIAGLWLRSSVWDDVAQRLRAVGHRPVAVPLPGQDDGDLAATLDDQLTAALGAVDAADGPMVVGHSAAATLAWLAADRRPQWVARAVLVGGFPASEGAAYADLFERVDGAMPFPGWAAFEGPDSDDFDEPARERFVAGAVPVAGGVSTATVHYTDPRRHDVAVSVVCPEFDPADAQAWIGNGDVPELGAARTLSYADIDSGHWPMITRPAELATLLDGLATQSS